MEYQEKHCEKCGQKVEKYSVQLTEGIVRALIKFRQAIDRKKENRIHLLKDIQGDIKLTPHEWNNFTRLRFHALVAKFRENGKHVAGYWLLTKRGGEFLRGETDVPKTVTVFNNKVISHSEDRVFIKDIIGELPYFEKIENIVYETATEDDIEKTMKTKKRKKVKDPCPKCGAHMKTGLRDKYDEKKQTAIVEKYLKCPECGAEDFIL